MTKPRPISKLERTPLAVNGLLNLAAAAGRCGLMLGEFLALGITPKECGRVRFWCEKEMSSDLRPPYGLAVPLAVVLAPQGVYPLDAVADHGDRGHDERGHDDADRGHDHADQGDDADADHRHDDDEHPGNLGDGAGRDDHLDDYGYQGDDDHLDVDDHLDDYGYQGDDDHLDVDDHLDDYGYQGDDEGRVVGGVR